MKFIGINSNFELDYFDMSDLFSNLLLFIILFILLFI